MKSRALRIAAIVCLVVIGLIMAGTALAQTDTSWCVAADGVTPVGCVVVTLNPAGTTGDFFLGETLLVAGQNPGKLVLPPGSQHVTVKNVKSTEPGFGTLFDYPDGAATVYTTAGQITSSSVFLTKHYIRGTLGLTCDVRNNTPTDVLGCAVTIDTVPQPDVLAPGAKMDYVLDPGPHTVNVTLTGDSAKYWIPASHDHPITITAGRATPIASRFDKMAHLTITLSQPTVLGDIYVDGTLLAPQVLTIDTWLAPAKSHKIEVKGVTDPAQADLYHWKDATSTVFLTAGQEKTSTITLVQEWYKGFIELNCTITNYQQGMMCAPVLDGVPQAQVAPGTPTTYTVPTGSHKLIVTIEPASDWGSTPKSIFAYVTGGKTFKANASLTAIAPKFDITLTNNSYTEVCNVYIQPAGTTDWGTDKLIGTVPVGSSKVFTVDKGTYNLYAQNCSSNPLGIVSNVAVTAPTSWVVTGPAVQPGGVLTLFTIANNTPWPVCTVLFAAVNGPQDNPPMNWLGPDQTVGSNAKRDFLLPSGLYVTGIVSCDTKAYLITPVFIEPGVHQTFPLDVASYTKPKDYSQAPYLINIPTH
jgi:hypothetical protein